MNLRGYAKDRLCNPADIVEDDVRLEESGILDLSRRRKQAWGDKTPNDDERRRAPGFCDEHSE